MGSEDMGDMMAMMSKMIECGKGMGPHVMPEKMMEIMPQCLGMMLLNMPKEKRIAFTLNMVATLREQGCVGMSEKEKEDFFAKIVEKVTG